MRYPIHRVMAAEETGLGQAIYAQYRPETGFIELFVDRAAQLCDLIGIGCASLEQARDAALAYALQQLAALERMEEGWEAMGAADRHRAYYDFPPEPTAEERHAAGLPQLRAIF